MQGRWSLTAPLFAPAGEPAASGPARRRALAELLLERYGIVTRELVLAEGVQGGFAVLYDSLAQLETLGVCRRGYFIEGLGGAQFALPGAVERLRSRTARPPARGRAARARRGRPGAAVSAPRCRGRSATVRAAARRASPAPTSCSSTPSLRCTSSAAGAAC